VGVIGLALAILAYETLGGMRAVAWTDAAQGLVMLVGLGILLSWIVTDAGGLEAVSRSVAATRPSAVAVPDAATCANWFSTIVLLGLASVVYPQAIQRIYAARSAGALQRSFAAMSFMPLVTTFVVTLIGVAAIARIDPASGIASDEVMPALLSEWAATSPWHSAGAVVVFLGALAAIMSTADSCLLSLGALLAQDLLGLPRDQDRTTLVGKTLAAGLLLVSIPIALQGDVTLWRLIELKMELLIQCVPAFLLALHWSKLRAGPTLAGLVVGSVLAVALTLGGLPRVLGVHVGVLGLAANAAIAVLGSCWQARAERGTGLAVSSGTMR